MCFWMETGPRDERVQLVTILLVDDDAPNSRARKGGEYGRI